MLGGLEVIGYWLLVDGKLLRFVWLLNRRVCSMAYGFGFSVPVNIE